MHRTSTLLCFLALTAACPGGSGRGPATSHGAAPATPTVIPRALLFSNPERAAPTLSPDGKWIAFGAPVDGVMNVFVAPADALDRRTQVTFDRQRPIRNYYWSSDSAYVLYEQDAAGDENFHIYRVGRDGKAPLDLTPRPGVAANLVALSPRHPGFALIGMNDRDPRLHDVYKVNLTTGAAERVLENPGVIQPIADGDLRLRLAQRFKPDGSIEILTASADGWTPRAAVPSDDQLTTQVVAIEASGARYYMLDSRDRDTAALFAVDMATGKQTLLAEHPGADADGVIAHPTTGAVRAVSFTVARPEWKIIDPGVGPDLAALAKLDEGDFAVTSMSDDDRTWIVTYNGDRAPVRYWRWDRQAQRGTFLFDARPKLAGQPLARTHAVEIPARDGLTLVSYLTLPLDADPDQDGRPERAAPMVLLVHGGPWARDHWGYSPMVQLLANRGYAVLRVNFRGSTGFGKRFINAADRQWGKAMHDDLLDGVAWAVSQGVTRADDVCIAGGSYGGYATLAGLTLTPTVFKCGVDIVGPSNLITLVESVPAYWQPIITVFKRRMGDWTTPEGRAALTEVSPLTHADRIVRPLLIAQGANDPRVKQAESDRIVAAMQAKGLPVTYALFPDEGHGFARSENTLAFAALTEAFLAQHLGGRVEPLTDADFAGSSVQLPAGAEHLRGVPASVTAAR